MGKTYLTADLHINHDYEAVYGPRGFKSIQESNETIIRNWTNTVTEEDTVIVVGDFIMGADMEYLEYVLSILPGHIILVIGNHETEYKLQIYRNPKWNIEVVDIKRITHKGRKFYISHYPTLTANFNDTPATAIVNIFGHTHSKEKFFEGCPYMYNVAVDAHNCTPVDLDQAVEEIEDRIKEVYGEYG